MWILPQNLKLQSAFVPDYVESKEELKNCFPSGLSFMWKSKPLLWPIWFRQWSMVFWIRPLFGRIVKPLTHSRFVTEYSCSLAVIRANPSVGLESDREPTTQDTFGRTLKDISAQQDLFAASLKMSAIILALDSPKWQQAYEVWVTGLRQDYSRRQKLADHMKENGFLSSLWPTPKTNMATGAIIHGNGGQDIQTVVKLWTTPVASDLGRNTMYAQGGTALSLQVKNWSTPTLGDWKGGSEGQNQDMLAKQVKKWPTPRSSDFKGCGPKGSKAFIHQMQREYLSAMVENISGQQGKESVNTHGKRREQLNPGWVAQLMGTTLEKIFFVPLVTE